MMISSEQPAQRLPFEADWSHMTALFPAPPTLFDNTIDPRAGDRFPFSDSGLAN